MQFVFIIFRFKSTSAQETAVKSFPAFSEVRSQLYRQQEKTHMPDLFKNEVHVTLRGKDFPPDDVNFQERFLLYFGQDGHLTIFCADTELRILRESQYLICDGTFEKASNSSFQLYTVHGFYKGEAMPLVYTLLPN